MDFVQVQAAHLMLVLLFTFARSESPVAKAYSPSGRIQALPPLPPPTRLPPPWRG